MEFRVIGFITVLFLVQFVIQSESARLPSKHTVESGSDSDSSEELAELPNLGQRFDQRFWWFFKPVYFPLPGIPTRRPLTSSTAVPPSSDDPSAGTGDDETAVEPEGAGPADNGGGADDNTGAGDAPAEGDPGAGGDDAGDNTGTGDEETVPTDNAEGADDDAGADDMPPESDPGADGDDADRPEEAGDTPEDE